MHVTLVDSITVITHLLGTTELPTGRFVEGAQPILHSMYSLAVEYLATASYLFSSTIRTCLVQLRPLILGKQSHTPIKMAAIADNVSKAELEESEYVKTTRKRLKLDKSGGGL